jgi:hypothetical protein
MARFISPNSADAGSSNFAAIVVFALIMTGSDVSAGRPDAGASTFASITVDLGLGFIAARSDLSRTWTADGSSVFAALVDLVLVVSDLVLDDAGVGSIGRLVAVLPSPFASVHASMLACGGQG